MCGQLRRSDDFVILVEDGGGGPRPVLPGPGEGGTVFLGGLRHQSGKRACVRRPCLLRGSGCGRLDRPGGTMRRREWWLETRHWRPPRPVGHGARCGSSIGCCPEVLPLESGARGPCCRGSFCLIHTWAWSQVLSEIGTRRISPKQRMRKACTPLLCTERTQILGKADKS